jgi:NAD-dependent dihydropyrimidine dehydrogenase PreA subunit
MKRDIIHIDEEKCNGCGECIPNCHEGALQLIDGKARLISDLMCDGLGACIGHCPEGAITMEKREAEPYNEVAVMKEMVKKGKNVVIAHLIHLKEHNQKDYLKQGVQFLAEKKDQLNFDHLEVMKAVHNSQSTEHKHVTEPVQQVQAMNEPDHGGGCPGSRSFAFQNPTETGSTEHKGDVVSQLTHWPVQMHLINPAASYFKGSDFLLAADCTAFSLGHFHEKFLKGRTLGIACPKLDTHMEVYLEKLQALIEQAGINTLTVMVMEVPCCSGLLQIAKSAADRASRKVPVKSITVGTQGEIIKEEWI